MSKKILFWFFIIVIFGLLSFKILGHEHSFNDWYVKVNPTEETTGLKVRECKKCGQIEERVIAKLIHVHDSDSEITVEPTCVSTGILTSVCKKCGVVQELEIDKDPDGHKYSEYEEVIEKMTEETGTKKRICSLCNETEEEKHNHELGEWYYITEETCKKAGIIEAKCVHCSYKRQQEVPIGTHKYTEWDVYKKPTCVSTGKAKRNCIYCNLEEQTDLSIDPSGHNYTEWKIIIKETLESEGLKRRECTICKKVEEEIIPAHEHEMTEWNVIVASTCSKGGTAVRNCKGCSYKESTALKPDESLHKFGSWTVITQATCNNAGQQKHKCTVCNKEVFEIVPRLEHNYELDGKTKPGYVLEKCTLCGHVKAEYIDKPNKD